MKPDALVQARSHWIALNEICVEIEEAIDLRVLRRRWIEFLDRIYKIQEMLENRAPEKKRYQDTTWRNKTIKERNENELLSYLRAARNVSNHGLGDPTRITEYWQMKSSVAKDYDAIVGKKPEWEQFVRSHKDATFSPLAVRLVPIRTEEHGKTVVNNPPIEHLGNMLVMEMVGLTPRCIARIVVSYFAKLIAAAETV